MQKRRTLSPTEKAKVIARQRNRCACGCGYELIVGQIDFDHEVPLWTTDDAETLRRLNDIANFRALVRKHHLDKSSKEHKARAKADRVRAKHDGTYLNAKNRELKSILDRTRLIERPSPMLKKEIHDV